PNIFFAINKYGQDVITPQTGIFSLVRKVDMGETIFLQVHDVHSPAIQSDQELPIGFLDYGSYRTNLQGIGVVVITRDIIELIVKSIVQGQSFVVIAQPDFMVIIHIKGPNGIGLDAGLTRFAGNIMVQDNSLDVDMEQAIVFRGTHQGPIGKG